MEQKSTTVTREQAIKAGGQLWEKYGKSRVYFNGLAELMGLEVARYNTGNICSASFRGEHVSNSEAKRIIGRLTFAKFWWEDGQFIGKDIERSDFADLVESIESKVA